MSWEAGEFHPGEIFGDIVEVFDVHDEVCEGIEILLNMSEVSFLFSSFSGLANEAIFA